MAIVALGFGVLGNWPQWAGDEVNSSLQLMAGAMSSAVVKWSVDLGGPVEWRYSAVADVDGDGRTEVVIANGRKIYCFDGATGSLKWSYDSQNDWMNYSNPAVADADGDGIMEIYVTGAVFGAYSGSDGSLLRTFSHPHYRGGPAVTLTDIDDDGDLEVVAGTKGVVVFNARTGAAEWYTDTLGHYAGGPPAVADVDGDGQKEVIIGLTDDYGDTLLCYGPMGFLKWARCFGNFFATYPTIADMDGDGLPEILIGDHGGTIHCVDGMGNVKWSFSGNDWYIGGVSVADVDGDGVLEAIWGDFGGEVYCVDGATGSLEWKAYFPARIHCPGALADLDGDGELEYLVSQNERKGSKGVRLYAINTSDGSVLWSVSAGTDVHTPFAADVDDDGCVEVIAGTYEGDLFVLDDPQNARNCESLGQTEGKPSSEQWGLKPAPGRVLVWALPGEPFDLEAYDPSGRLVKTLFSGALASGRGEFSLPEKPGVYEVVLRWKGGQVSKIAYGGVQK